MESLASQDVAIYTAALRCVAGCLLTDDVGSIDRMLLEGLIPKLHRLSLSTNYLIIKETLFSFSNLTATAHHAVVFLKETYVVDRVLVLMNNPS